MTKLSGYEAIDYAEANGLTLSKYNDPTDDAREGLTPDEARKIAADDPSLIHVGVETTRHDGGLNDPLSLSAGPHMEGDRVRPHTPTASGPTTPDSESLRSIVARRYPDEVLQSVRLCDDSSWDEFDTLRPNGVIGPHAWWDDKDDELFGAIREYIHAHYNRETGLLPKELDGVHIVQWYI